MNEVVPGKETVVRRAGATWSFALREGETIKVDRDAGTVTLSMPAPRGCSRRFEQPS